MTGLVLEGGGMRGIYTAGVLDCLHDHDLFFPYIVGVSAGACHACSYIARQRGRNLNITQYIPDKRYMSFQNLLKTGSFFGMKFVFEEIPKHLLPFDYESFQRSAAQFYTGAIDIETGKTHYFSKSELDDQFLPVQASMSLPGISRIVTIEGKMFLDGGISSPIPLDKSLQDGNDRHIIVLTQPKGFQKQPQKINGWMRLSYQKYPHLLHAMAVRHTVYNDTVALSQSLEKQGSALIIRPSVDLKIGRLEKDTSRIRAQYDLGYEDTLKQIQNLRQFV